MLLYPAQPFAARVPDEAYAEELALAQGFGLEHALLDLEALLEGDLNRALRWVKHANTLQTAIYRGWMLRPQVYGELYTALTARNWRLINSPAQYRHTHFLPESFAAIADDSPHTVWLPMVTATDADWTAVQAALAGFGAVPLIVKDYVKSRKHEWAEACFIPDAADLAQASRVIQIFLDRQGSEFQGGLVLRAFEPFAPLSQHSRSGMPLTREYRLFVLDQQIISAAPYWEEGEYPVDPLPTEPFAKLAGRVQSRLFTMDVAQRTDGVWRVMELGDGQVAGLPERADKAGLYAALARALAGSPTSG
jgi:ATP-grasp domain, R2K clade family 3